MAECFAQIVEACGETGRLAGEVKLRRFAYPMDERVAEDGQGMVAALQVDEDPGEEVHAVLSDRCKGVASRAMGGVQGKLGWPGPPAT